MRYTTTNSTLDTKQRINSERIEVYCAYTAYSQPTLEALAIYLHACAGFPVTET